VARHSVAARETPQRPAELGRARALAGVTPTRQRSGAGRIDARRCPRAHWSITLQHAVLGQRLERWLETGLTCRYRP